MADIIPGVKYAWDSPNQRWIAPGRGALGMIAPFPAKYTDATAPWRLKAGESLTDNMPSGVPIVQASTYSSSNDIRTVLLAIEAGAPASCYVQLAPQTYYLNNFHDYNSDATYNFIGFANGSRKVMGLIGHGADTTIIRVVPTAISATPEMVNYTLNKTSVGGPVANTALYFSNTSTSVPLFFSGIGFDGTLQTPYSVYSTGSQAHFRINHGAASPLAWNGITFVRGIAGSRMQFCRFRGFSFGLNSAPPFESGTIGTNYMNGFTAYRIENDGRIAAHLDASRPRAGGGLMWNKGINELVQDSWQHHTRRSGWAMNTNTLLQSERYKGVNFQCEEIANNPNDGWAGDNGYFNGSNVEGMVGIFEYHNVRLNVASGSHINYAVPYSGENGVYSAPNHASIVVRGFKSDDTLYGGCLRIGVSRNPNSTGESPIWAKVNSQGIAGCGLFDIQNSQGDVLTGVRHTDWNSTMTPDTHYVVRY